MLHIILCTLISVQEPSSEQESTGEAISVDLRSPPAIHTALAIVEHTAAPGYDHMFPSSSPPVSSTLEQTSLSGAFAGFDIRGSATASVASDILGVSADSSEFCSLGTRFHGYRGGDVSEMSYLSLQDLSEVSLVSSQNDKISTDLRDNLETNSHQKAHSPLLGHLQPESPLVTSSVFSSTQYGPIVSAAQSTTLLCGSESLVECSSLSEITEERLEEIMYVCTCTVSTYGVAYFAC